MSADQVTGGGGERPLGEELLKDDYGDTWKLIGAIELHRIRN